jgi:hypothetical protein
MTQTTRYHRNGTEVTTPVTILNENNGAAETTFKTTCGKCGGTGRIEYYHYIAAGVCFACGGNGGKVKTVRVYTAEKLAGLDAAQAKRDAIKIEKANAKAAAQAEQNRKDLAVFLAEHGALIEAATATGNAFAKDVCKTALNKIRLTERQIECLKDCVDRAAKEAAEPKTDVPEGRLQITGTVLSVKWQDNGYGGCEKMLVKDGRGFKVWGSVPSSLEVNRGDVVTFTATVERSDNDSNFGFFKRPTKADKVS